MEAQTENVNTQKQLVQGTVAGCIWLKGLPPKTALRIKEHFSFPNPEYIKAKRYGKSTDGLEKQHYCITEYPNGTLGLPRGAVSDLRVLLAAEGVDVQWKDIRTTGTPFKRQVQAIDCRAYQAAAAKAFLANVQGTIVFPCGGGKTHTGVAIANAIGLTTLIIAHTDDLLDQWEKSVIEKMKIKPGVFNAKRKEIMEDIVIASIWTLEEFLKQYPEYGQRFGVLIGDEMHRFPAATFQAALPYLTAKYRLGLSATPERDDGYTPLIEWSFGKCVYKQDIHYLYKHGWLDPPRIEFIRSNFSFDDFDFKKAYLLEKAIITDDERNKLIVDIAGREVRAGQSVLILSNRKEHCETLRVLLEQQKVRSFVVTANTKKKVRKGTIDAMRDGKIQCMIATSLADEGLDIPRLSRIILALPQKAKGPTIQRVGRIMRPLPGKSPPVVYDIVDPNVPVLVKRASERRKAYREIGLLLRFSFQYQEIHKVSSFLISGVH